MLLYVISYKNDGIFKTINKAAFLKCTPTMHLKKISIFTHALYIIVCLAINGSFMLNSLFKEMRKVLVFKLCWTLKFFFKRLLNCLSLHSLAALCHVHRLALTYLSFHYFNTTYVPHTHIYIQSHILHTFAYWGFCQFML